jgi:membrane protease YdiL (CAAX protease family)
MMWFLVAGLLVLRIPFLGGMRYFTWTRTSSWVMPIFEVGTYLLTAILIWVEREHLSDFHVDRLALFILIFGKPAELLWSRFPGTGGRYLGSEAYLLYVPISLGLVVGLIFCRPKLCKLRAKKWLWVGIGVLTGVIVGVLSGWLSKLEFNPSRSQLTLETLILLPIQEMLYAAIAEEPVFRGLLWGALRKSGWREGWVWVAQGVLFWLAHIYLIERSPVTFWVIVPLGGLVFGLLAWRSRSIGVSMIAHGLANGVLKHVVLYRLR